MKKIKIEAKNYLFSNLENEELKDILIALGKKYDFEYYNIAYYIYQKNYKYKLIASKYNVSESYIKRLNDDILLITVAYLHLKKRG